MAITDDSGRFEVYAQSYPVAQGKWRISKEGGSEPKWRADGRELYFLGFDRWMMAVTVRPGASLQVDPPRRLFATRIPNGVNPNRRRYDVTRDGQRFLIQSVTQDDTVSPITVILNWTAALKR